MSVTNITAKGFTTTEHRYSAQSCVEYLEDATPHNADSFVTSRNLLKTSNYGNLLPIIKRQQREITRRNYRKDPKTGEQKVPIQAYSIVQSFGPDEFNYKDPDDVQQAHRAGVELARAINKRTGGNRAWAVYTQADNLNHVLHNHVVMLNYDSHQKAMKHGISWKKELYPLSDSIIESLLTTPKQKKAHEKTKAGAKEAANRSTKEARQARQNKAQQRFEYIRRVVMEAKDEAKDANEFSDLLKKQGIEIQARNKKLNNEFTTDEASKWYTKSGRVRKAVAFSYQGVTVRTSRLKLTPDGLLKQFQRNNMLQKQRQKQRQIRIEQQADNQQKPTTNDKQKVSADKRQKVNNAKPSQTPKTTKAKSTKTIKRQKPKAEPQSPKSEHQGINPYIAELQKEVTEYSQKMVTAKTKQERKMYLEKLNNANIALGNMTDIQAVNETAKAQQRQKQKEEETEWE